MLVLRGRKIRRSRKKAFAAIFLFGCIMLGSIGIECKQEEAMPVLEAEGEEESELDEKRIEVYPILQNPELPTGCEATAAAMLLNAYGYVTEKTVVADYLPKGEIVEYNGRTYAPHPNEKFTGDPYTRYGYGVFPDVLAETMQEIIDEMEGAHQANALYNLTEEELLQKIEEGTPVCVWTSMDDKEIEYRGGWYLIQEGMYTDCYYEWPSNEHVVVLTHYDEKYVTVCDPLRGVCRYSRESFFRHYKQVGSYALELCET